MNPQNQDQSEKFRKEAEEEKPTFEELLLPHPDDRVLICIGFKAYFNIGEKKINMRKKQQDNGKENRTDQI